MSTLLEGYVFLFAGNFIYRKHPEMKRSIKSFGGRNAQSLTPQVTHLIITPKFALERDPRYVEAKKMGITCIDSDWLEYIEKHKKLPIPGAFEFTERSQVRTLKEAEALLAAKEGEAGNLKREADDVDSDGGVSKKVKTEDCPVVKQEDEPVVKEEDSHTTKPLLSVPDLPNYTNDPSSLSIPLDDDSFPAGSKVYISPEGLIYDASLNQTNAGRNNNKFYRLQVIQHTPTTFTCWARWGRVGDRGQTKAIAGPLDKTLKEFSSKFRTKSGYPFPTTGAPKSGKYVFVEKSYEPETAEEAAAQAARDAAFKGIAQEGIKEEEELMVESALPKPVQDVVGLIFNRHYINESMKSMNYDADKMPLGKLGENTIRRGFAVLKDLAAVLNGDAAVLGRLEMSSPQAIEYLSNSYYSLIPHAFGRRRPPIIQTSPLLKIELSLLESLSDMKAAEDILAGTKKSVKSTTCLLDEQFRGLNLEELTPLEPGSAEYVTLADYMQKTRGSTHRRSVKIKSIFRLRRPGEHARFSSAPWLENPSSHRRLLWHGSRSTNFAGILSQGLRIAPPEAPVSGYMFGKGIYLADMSSKSGGYCYPELSGNNALLLLCEAELGNMRECEHADCDAAEKAKKEGFGSTWGKGRMAPREWVDAKETGLKDEQLDGCLIPKMDGEVTGETGTNAALMYNEFIVYDVSQVRLRYLFQVDMR